ncbi:MAG: translation elongation factor Ts [Pseudomonadaceae bacterium]|nr:translation elongation factor Ts [Pseudomonadaceae bacterium]
MAVTAAMVKELRERTGLGMMDCKKALTECDGDMDAAIDLLRKNSAVKAAKKADRTAAEGLLAVRVSDDGKTGVLAEVNIETDFAAKNDQFIAFVAKVADTALAKATSDIDALGLESEREALVQSIGENLSIRRIALIQADAGRVVSYLHTDQRKGALVQIEGSDDAELGRDIAMHITATSPMVTEPAQVSEDVIAKEREIFTAQAEESGKPPEIIEKMIEGRIRKFLAEVSLTEQAFVKDPNTKVSALLKSAGASVGSFHRFEVGEGIEVATTDFASEVQAQLRGDQ